ncbi:MAG: hypothetical protein WCH61_05640 [bacterium]
MSVLLRLRLWLGSWMLAMALVLATWPVLAQTQTGTPDLGEPRSPVRLTSSGNSLTAAMDGSANWISSDLITKSLLFIISR